MLKTYIQRSGERDILKEVNVKKYFITITPYKSSTIHKRRKYLNLIEGIYSMAPQCADPRY